MQLWTFKQLQAQVLSTKQAETTESCHIMSCADRCNNQAQITRQCQIKQISLTRFVQHVNRQIDPIVNLNGLIYTMFTKKWYILIWNVTTQGIISDRYWVISLQVCRTVKENIWNVVYVEPNLRLLITSLHEEYLTNFVKIKLQYCQLTTSLKDIHWKFRKICPKTE